MSRHHQPRKRFGQNFLRDQTIIGKIIAAIGVSRDDHVVEIGPGTGALTEHLIMLCDHLRALELDRDLSARLSARFAEDSRLEVISGDALKTDFGEFYTGTSLRLVGNLPYNISTPLIFHVLRQRHLIKDMHFMLQREVVDRLAASPSTKDYGRLSVMVQYHCRVLPLIPVPPTAFVPAPKVQSAFVRLVPYSQPETPVEDEVLLSQLVSVCFQQRRKTLRNCLRGITSMISELGSVADLNLRPEQLSVMEYVLLCNRLTQLNKRHASSTVDTGQGHKSI